MIRKDQQVKCVLVDPPDQISDMAKSRQAPRVTEMHEVYRPLGLAYIAATLLENSIDVSLIEARTRSLSHDEVISRIEKEAPQFVGITVITARINSALYLAEKVKKISPDIKVILGGPHIHFDHKTVINNDSVDFCVRGEGEITCLEWTQGQAFTPVLSTRGCPYQCAFCA